jgi:hypothetical protein
VIILIIELFRHAKEQLINRGFSIKEVEECIRVGSKTLQDGKIISTYRDYKVVYKKLKERYYVITIMYRW